MTVEETIISKILIVKMIKILIYLYIVAEFTIIVYGSQLKSKSIYSCMVCGGALDDADDDDDDGTYEDLTKIDLNWDTILVNLFCSISSKSFFMF